MEVSGRGVHGIVIVFVGDMCETKLLCPSNQRVHYDAFGRPNWFANDTVSPTRDANQR